MGYLRKISLFLFFAVFMVSGTVFLLNLVRLDFPQASNQNEKKEIANTEFQNLGDYSDIILAESILSILKSYYVDKGRVENIFILESIISTLKEKLDLQVVKNKQEFIIESKSGQLVLDYSPDLSYDLLLYHSLKIGKFIEPLLDQSDLSATVDENVGTLFVLQNLLLSLDSHSSILSSESYAELRQGTEGEFGGLGVLVGMRDQLLTVIKPLPRSPAARAGVEKKDRILAINGQETYGKSLMELVELMQGSPGSKVTLSLLREGEQSSLDIDLKREVIVVDSVSKKYFKKDYGDILYLSIDSFTSRTANEISSILEARSKLDSASNLEGIILDLRSNPGGLLDQAVKVADLFLDEGVIVTTKGRNTEIEIAYDEKSDELLAPIIILINEESASASEIVAGALQDHERALILGQPSFGKASVQSIFELPEGRALKLTIARYYTPDGASIQNVGIVPNIWVQPIYRKNENLNILGDFRYKSERFLFNHLSLYDDDTFFLNTFEKAKYHGFYLKNEKKEFVAEEKLDHEILFSLSMFDALNKRSLNNSDEFKSGAKTWLKYASSDINYWLNHQNKEVDSFLKENFSINWMAANTSKNSDDISVRFLIDSELSVKPGQLLKIDYLIENHSNQAISNLSVFTKNNQMEFATSEKLISSIDKKSKLKDHFDFEVPAYLPPGRYTLQVGLASSGSALPKLFKNIELNVQKRLIPELDVEVALEKEKGGSITGVLEAHESASLAVSIFNHSSLAARDLSIKILNLAGKQVLINKKNLSLKNIPAHGSATLYFPLKGSKIMVDRILTMGLLIESNDLDFPLKKRSQIIASPNL